MENTKEKTEQIQLKKFKVRLIEIYWQENSYRIRFCFLLTMQMVKKKQNWIICRDILMWVLKLCLVLFQAQLWCTELRGNTWLPDHTGFCNRHLGDLTSIFGRVFPLFLWLWSFCGSKYLHYLKCRLFQCFKHRPHLQATLSHT